MNITQFTFDKAEASYDAMEDVEADDLEAEIIAELNDGDDRRDLDLE